MGWDLLAMLWCTTGNPFVNWTYVLNDENYNDKRNVGYGTGKDEDKDKDELLHFCG